MQIIRSAEIRPVLNVWYPPEHTYLRVAERPSENKLLGINVVDQVAYTQKPLRYVPVALYVAALFQVSTLLLGLFIRDQHKKDPRVMSYEEFQLWMGRYRVYTHWIREIKFSALCLTGEPFDITVEIDRFRPRGYLPSVGVQFSGAIKGAAQYVVDRTNKPDRVYHMSDEICARHPELF